MDQFTRLGTVRLRRALQGDLPSVVDIWVDALTDDPYLRWIQPDDEVWPAFGTAWLTFVAEHCASNAGTCIWPTRPTLRSRGSRPTSRSPLPTTSRGSRHHRRARRPDARRRCVRHDRDRERRHLLEEPHWTLQYVGVRRARQGTGLGGAAVAPGLARSDDESLPCSLVSTNARNVPFYERLGFTVHSRGPHAQRRGDAPPDAPRRGHTLTELAVRGQPPRASTSAPRFTLVALLRGMASTISIVFGTLNAWSRSLA